MVSNARLGLPDPDSPVTTTRRSRGISSEMFLRLWTRAPCTATVVRAAAFGAFPAVRLPFALELIRGFSGVEEGDFLNLNIAPLRELDGRGRLADESPVRQVLADRGHAAHAEVPVEMAFDLCARPRLAGLAQVVDHRREERRR